jgi:hypothetical protein
MMAKVQYREGDWFAVPLRNSSFAVGLIARTNPRGVLLGYFFGPRRDSVPSINDLADLKPNEALMVQKFGHLGLTGGKWLIGHAPAWDRSDWPMPVFVRYEELSGRSFRVFYEDRDPNALVREEQTPPGIGEQGPKDGLLGAGAVERVLTSLLQ